MELHELTKEQEIIIQIVWGENKIEFYSHMVGCLAEEEAIFITPYVHNGQPLELNIDQKSGIICNMFCDDPYNGNRISWRNVEMETIHQESRVAYKISTSEFNRQAQLDDRRVEERIIINLYGTVIDSEGNATQIKVRDISDGGIGFYTPSSFQNKTNQIKVMFEDHVNGADFSMSLVCKIVRAVNKTGTMFYGCRVMGENREFLLYGCMRRAAKKLSANDIILVDKDTATE